jgi:hypothetical protein
MFDNHPANTSDRPRGALEIAIRARAREKSLALVVADFQAENSARPAAKKKQTKGLLTSLFAIFR